MLSKKIYKSAIIGIILFLIIFFAFIFLKKDNYVVREQINGIKGAYKAIDRIFDDNNTETFNQDSNDNMVSDESIQKDHTATCKENLLKLNYDELVDRILGVNEKYMIPETDDYWRYLYLRDATQKYLQCKYVQAENLEIKNNIFKTELKIIENDSKRKGKGEKIIPVAQENFKNPEKSFLHILATRDFNDFCPDELPKICAKEINILHGENLEWCKNICSILNNYKYNKDAYKKDIENFLNTDKTLEHEMYAYSWRIAFIYGLEGKDEAFRFCESKPSEPINAKGPCRSYANRMDLWDANCSEYDLVYAQSMCERKDYLEKFWNIE